MSKSLATIALTLLSINQAAIAATITFEEPNIPIGVPLSEGGAFEVGGLAFSGG